MAGYVFVSYSRRDQPYVRRLVRHLADHGVTTWYDSETETGARFVPVVQEKIDGCAAVLVVWSAAAADSAWVERETLYAGSAGRPILPLWLDHTVPLGILLGALQAEPVDDDGMPSDDFIARLKALCDGSASASPGAAPRGVAAKPPETTRRTLSDRELRALVDAFEQDEVVYILDRVGFPRGSRPAWGPPLTFWHRVNRLLGDGAMRDGGSRIVEVASELRPHNEAFSPRG
ncbi:TIR domain-containing protein [Cryptosporangium phraense]|uniref:TIR domain-containing protein n=1 Tax=Cryptosporangium phraense TaxID=2593070 RepID=UPI0014790838|nr:TIR domain-containing protein [Cryptosporangium phraense]